MILYPAIDMLDGQAVRLRQGKRDDVTIFGNPVELAKKWRSKGAEWLHLVDLTAAFVIVCCERKGRKTGSDGFCCLCGFDPQGFREFVDGGISPQEDTKPFFFSYGLHREFFQ